MQTTTDARRKTPTAVSSESSDATHSAAEPALRVALVRQKYRVDGGGEQIVSRLSSVLRQQGHQVTLITRSWQKDSPSIIRCDPPRLGRALKEWLFARAVTRQVRLHDFDLVQSHERIPGCQVYRAGDGVHREWLRQRKRIRHPATRWWLDLSPYHRYVKKAEKLLFENDLLRLVICNSRMVMREIVDYFRIDANKLRLVYNGVDTEKFHPRLREHRNSVRVEWGIPDEATTFLFVGSGFERKGLLQAMHALAAVPKAHLLAVGKDKALRRFQRLGRQLGIDSRVHLTGMQADVRPFYGAADALLLPTLYDPFPNVVMESMATGLPIITSTKCGGAELVTEGNCGYVCDALDHDGLVRAMRSLRDQTVCSQLGARARDLAAPHTLAAMRDQLITIYQEVLNEPVRS